MTGSIVAAEGAASHCKQTYAAFLTLDDPRGGFFGNFSEEVGKSGLRAEGKRHLLPPQLAASHKLNLLL